MKPAVVLIGHGSRRATSAEQFKKLVASYSDCTTDHTVYHGYIELHEPLMGEVIEAVLQSHNEVTVMPVLLFNAAHAKTDIPELLEMLKNKYPEKTIRYADVLGVHEKMAELAHKRIGSAITKNDPDVLMIGRGTSYQPAIDDFNNVCDLVRTRFKMRVTEGFIAAAKPHYKDALQTMIENGCKNIVIAPYVLFPGVLLKQIREYAGELKKEYPMIQLVCADCLNVDNLLLEVMKERVDSAKNF